MNEQQIVVFSVGSGEYGINLSDVSIVENPSRVFKVPGTPEYIEGMVNIRGKVHTIVNTRKRLGYPPLEADENTKLLIIHFAGSPTALIADSVNRIITVAEKDIIADPEGSPKKYTRGILNQNNSQVMLLDLEKLLS